MIPNNVPGNSLRPRLDVCIEGQNWELALEDPNSCVWMALELMAGISIQYQTAFSLLPTARTQCQAIHLRIRQKLPSPSPAVPHRSHVAPAALSPSSRVWL
jgi:hypothetical protein